MPTRQHPRVHPSGRYLQTAAGAPYFWLGDTAWELFHRLTREEADRYLVDRAAKGFTLIQAVALAEFDGLHGPNAYGDLALLADDVTRPNPAYFAHVDAVIARANALGLVVGLLPTWGDKVRPLFGVGPRVFDVANATAYGAWIGARYRDADVVWILGGDRPPVGVDQGVAFDDRAIWRALAAGVRAGAGADALLTYHPAGYTSSAEHLHEEPWLDLNLLQSGHGSGHDVPAWEWVARELAREPRKPVLDGEPNYEDHPVNPWPTWDPASGYFRDHDVRKQAYRSVFAGACGVTYGHHAIWQFCSDRNPPINHADRTWVAALDRPAAGQLIHLRRLIERFPYFTRVRDPLLIASEPGVGGAHVEATRDIDGTYALVYLPETTPVTVDLDRLAGDWLTVAWFDPRTGETTPPERIARSGRRTFAPPGAGPDWVLVLTRVE